MMTEDLFPYLTEIRDSSGLNAIMDPSRLRAELDKRGYARSEMVSLVMEESRDQFELTRTKPGPKELYSLSAIIASYLKYNQKSVLFTLNDLNDCIFGM